MPLLRRITLDDVELNVALAGTGPAVLLLHGFPHTWEVWTDVISDLAERHLVIAPDMRGFGASSRPRDGYDAGTLADDAAALLDALDVGSAAVVGIDAGAAPAFLLALRRPDLVRRLAVMEAMLGRLPGAEHALAGGPPWWFGFHAAAPELAETVLEGNEGAYIDWFLRTGTCGDGVPARIRDAFVRAYTGRDALNRAFSYYRMLPESATQIEREITERRLTVPTLAVGAHPVGAALEHQLRPLADDLTGHVIEDSGHIIPLHRPAALLAVLRPFLTADIAPENRVHATQAAAKPETSPST